MAAVTENKLKQILNTYIFFEQSKHEFFKNKIKINTCITLFCKWDIT